MFQIEDVLIAKEEKKGRFTGLLVTQPYELISNEDGKVMLLGLKENDIKYIDSDFLDIFKLDIDFTRKLKLNKICLRMAKK